MVQFYRAKDGVHKFVAKFDDGKVVPFGAFSYSDYTQKVPIPNYRVTLTGITGTNVSYYNSTQDLAAGDKIHVGITFSGGNQNKTHDLTIQLDMF